MSDKPSLRTRRFTLKQGALLAGGLMGAQPDAALPQSVQELWRGFDPRRDALRTQRIRQWQEGGITLQLLRFFIGSFKGREAWMAALYGFNPKDVGKRPGVMHVHGGGQRASIAEVRLLALRGYAVLSLNWGGSGNGKAPFNSCDGAQPGEPNTDWGAVDPTQLNAGHYDNLQPGPGQLHEDREHPQNDNWYLLTLGCRRGLTFLEQQEEVDASRLGVHGYSMGGNLTMSTIAVDDRVKAAVPAVGGQGWRWLSHEFDGQKAPAQSQVRGSVQLYQRCLSFEAMAPLIRCPVLHRSATNDFHGWMDDVYRTQALIPAPTQQSWTPHLNHRLSPEVAVSMPLWFDQHLKGGPALPATPQSTLRLRGDQAQVEFEVRAAPSDWPVSRCEIFYSVDADPRARFWRSGEVQREGVVFKASLPLHNLERDLHVFANVYHQLPQALDMSAIPGHGQPVREVCLSSQLHHASKAELAAAGPELRLKPSLLIEDFAHGQRDWYEINAGHVSLRQLWTRKVTDPLWKAPAAARLRLTLRLQKPNEISVVLQQNEWRNYRGQRRTFVCSRLLKGGAEVESLDLAASDFSDEQGALQDWKDLDQLGVCSQFQAKRVASAQGKAWQGTGFELLRVEWVPA